MYINEKKFFIVFTNAHYKKEQKKTENISNFLVPMPHWEEG